MRGLRKAATSSAGAPACGYSAMSAGNVPLYVRCSRNCCRYVLISRLRRRLKTCGGTCDKSTVVVEAAPDGVERLALAAKRVLPLRNISMGDNVTCGPSLYTWRNSSRKKGQ